MPIAVGRDARSKGWTAGEDKLLAAWQERLGNKWAEVARKIPGKTGQQCAQRWRHRVNPNIRKEKWTEAEDDQLTQLFHLHGNAWAEIARNMEGRTDQQCMGRWKRHLDPDINRDPWREKEDKQLCRLYAKHGNQWSLTAKLITGRTPQQCRVRWYQLEGGSEQQAQGFERRGQGVKSANKGKAKNRGKYHTSSEEEWEGASSSEGTDFETEYLRNAKQLSSRRRSGVSGNTDEGNSGSSSSDDLSGHKELSPPRSPQPTKTQAQSRGVGQRVSSLRKQRRQLRAVQTPLLSTPALLCEESEGCETAIKRPAMRACRVIGTPFSPACNLSESTSIPEEPLDPTTESPGQQHPVSSGKCTRPVNRRCRLKPRSLTSPTVPSAERPTGGRSFTDVHACCEAAAGMDDAALGADILTAEALEPRQDIELLGARGQMGSAPNGVELLGPDSESPPLLPHQMQGGALVPCSSQILTASHFELTSPNKPLLSSQGCVPDLTPRRVSRDSRETEDQQTKQTVLFSGSKRNTPGGGFADASRDAWEISPTENVLHLFQSPDPMRGRSNPLQSPSFQSLATPEWARRDWVGPAVAAASDGRAEEAGHCQPGLSTAGRPSNRGPVARRLDVNPSGGGVSTSSAPSYEQNEPPASSHDSPAKRLRAARDMHQDIAPAVREKEASACCALERLTVAAANADSSRGGDSSSVDTQYAVLPCQTSPAPEARNAAANLRRTPRSKLSKASPARSMLERSEAIRSRLHALLDEL